MKQYKYLDKKAVSSFGGTSAFLQISQGIEQGLLNGTASIGNAALFTADLYAAISADTYSAVGQEWNALLRKVIDRALHSLLPAVTRGLFDTLTTQATQVVVDNCAGLFYTQVDMAGAAVPRKSTILAIHVATASVGVVLDAFGNYLHHFALSALTTQDRSSDINLIKDNIDRYKVHLVVCAGSHPQLVHLPSEIDCLIIDDAVARIYAASKRAVTEFPTLSPEARYAVSLARRALDPTTEFAALFPDEVALLSLHPLQSLLPPLTLLRALERVMINVVNSTFLFFNPVESMLTLLFSTHMLVRLFHLSVD